MTEIDTPVLETLLCVYVVAIRELRALADHAVQPLIGRLERLLLAAEAELAARAADSSFVPQPAPGLL